MAKIKTLTFEISGTKYDIVINCDNTGRFNAKLPTEIVTALNLQPKIDGLKLYELENTITEAVERYKNANTTEELHIALNYKSSGRYNWRKNKTSILFGDSIHSKYSLRLSGFDASSSGICFDYMVVIKETIDGNVKWYEATKGNDFATFAPQSKEPNKYHKGNTVNIRTWKTIKFDPISLETLENATEKLRQLSETLFNFIEQDEDNITKTLTNNKLLGA